MLPGLAKFHCFILSVLIKFTSRRINNKFCSVHRQWRNQVHFTGGATRGQALFKGGQQFNDIISNDVII